MHVWVYALAGASDGHDNILLTPIGLAYVVSVFGGGCYGGDGGGDNCGSDGDGGDGGAAATRTGGRDK